MTTATAAPGPATAQAEPILLEAVADGVATLTLNRPKQYNALSGAMLDALQRALESIEHDTAVRVVVIAGNGPAFCAGHDLKEMRAHPDKPFQEALFAQCSKFMLTLARIPQPVIARVHGIATAAGCQLVGACDLAVVSDNAKFAVSGINVGLFCSTPSVALSRNVSRKRAMEMLVTGDFIDAATAKDFGLVNRVVSLDALDAEVANLANAIIAKSPIAISMGKRLFYRQIEMGVEEAYGLAAQTMACNMMAEDAGEGIDAFMQKRPPSWKGR
jgi:enoyl-CoA hydratase/carnithine racemase